MRKQPELRAQLAREANVPARRFGLDDFRRLVVRLCPDLAYCRIVTNDAKASGIGSPKQRSNLHDGVAPTKAEWLNAKWVNVTWTSETWDLVIVENDRTKH